MVSYKALNTQLLKQETPIDVMLEGNSICDNFVQPLKASLLRLVILDGITILSRLEQPEKLS